MFFVTPSHVLPVRFRSPAFAFTATMIRFRQGPLAPKITCGASMQLPTSRCNLGHVSIPSGRGGEAPAHLEGKSGRTITLETKVQGSMEKWSFEKWSKAQYSSSPLFSFPRFLLGSTMRRRRSAAHSDRVPFSQACLRAPLSMRSLKFR